MISLKQSGLDILQEECGELIQAVSKYRRFGPQSETPEGDKTNEVSVQHEFWDIVIVAELSGLSILPPPDYIVEKLKKLKKYSDLVDNNFSTH